VQTEIEKKAGTSSGHCEEPLATRQSPDYRGSLCLAEARGKWPRTIWSGAGWEGRQALHLIP